MIVNHWSDNEEKNYNVVNHTWLYHLFGDPTMEVWTREPPGLVLPARDAVVTLRTECGEVRYPVSGVEITALQLGADGCTAIGRGIVSNGVARLYYSTKPHPFPLSLSANKRGAVSTQLNYALGGFDPIP